MALASYKYKQGSFVKQYRQSKHFLAYLVLIAYILLGILSPEGFSLLTSKLSGHHEISFTANQQGEQVLVLHHHGAEGAQHHPEAETGKHHTYFGHSHPDHVYVLPKSQQKAAFFSRDPSFKPAYKGIIIFPLHYKLPVASYLKTINPQKLPQPPPDIPRVVALRCTVVLII